MIPSVGVATLLLGAPAAARVCEPVLYPGLRPEGREVQFIGTAAAERISTDLLRDR